MSASRRLQHALVLSAQAAGCPVQVTDAQERPWSSATFVGARHAILLEGAPSPTYAAWLEDLAQGTLTIPGHVVADLRVERLERRACVEVLTLES